MFRLHNYLHTLNWVNKKKRLSCNCYNKELNVLLSLTAFENRKMLIVFFHFFTNK